MNNTFISRVNLFDTCKIRVGLCCLFRVLAFNGRFFSTHARKLLIDDTFVFNSKGSTPPSKKNDFKKYAVLDLQDSWCFISCSVVHAL